MTDLANPVLVAALYRFARFDAPAKIAAELRELCARSGVMGSLIVAGEGVNGTVAGDAAAVEALVAHLRTLPDCAGMDVKYARTSAIPFARMKVKEKAEIVTLGAGDLDPASDAGFHVEPADWNALIADPDTIVIDTRNNYEVELGSFAGAINPDTLHFRHFPAWFDAQAAAWRAQGRTPRIAMFCTGGIRCEKSTALAKARGFDEVYHLNGGILRYLEEVPQEDSLWQGDCFVFDRRVAVTHGLAPGGYAMCRPCGMPYPIGTAHRCIKDQGIETDCSPAS